MAKSEEKLRARVLRKKGFSILNIARKLSVSKSSVSEWCRDLILTPKQVKDLYENQKFFSLKGRMMGAAANKKMRLEAVARAENYGKNFIGKISSRELGLVVTALYWSEGSKDEGTSTFLFVNSDPQMILVIKRFLTDILGVHKNDIMCRIQINKIHENRINIVLNFWKKLLKLEESQMKKPYFVKTKANKVYENHNSYYGVCRLFVKKGKYTKYKILGMIKALKEEILPA